MVDYRRQEPLKLKRVNLAIVIGAGGVGSWAALLLSMTGRADRIAVVDDDVIEEHNLNRTPYMDIHVGIPKVTAIADVIAQYRPDQSVTPIRKKFDAAVGELTRMIEEERELDPDARIIVIDATDHPPTQDEIKRWAHTVNVPYIRGGYDGMDYTIEVVPRGETPRYDGWTVGSGYGVVIPSWVATPVYVAALITTIACTGEFPKNGIINGNLIKDVKGGENE